MHVYGSLSKHGEQETMSNVVDWVKNYYKSRKLQGPFNKIDTYCIQVLVYCTS